MDIDTLLNELEAVQKEAKAQSKAVFDTAKARLFEDIPTLQAIAWVQYTPVFNDGDPCVFSIGEVCTLFGDPIAVRCLLEEDITEEDEKALRPEQAEALKTILHEDGGLDALLNVAIDDELLRTAGIETTSDNESLNKFCRALGTTMRDMLETTFDSSGALVVVTRKGVEERDYDPGY